MGWVGWRNGNFSGNGSFRICVCLFVLFCFLLVVFLVFLFLDFIFFFYLLFFPSRKIRIVIFFCISLSQMYYILLYL